MYEQTQASNLEGITLEHTDVVMACRSESTYKIKAGQLYRICGNHGPEEENIGIYVDDTDDQHGGVIGVPRSYLQRLVGDQQYTIVADDSGLHVAHFNMAEYATVDLRTKMAKNHLPILPGRYTLYRCVPGVDGCLFDPAKICHVCGEPSIACDWFDVKPPAEPPRDPFYERLTTDPPTVRDVIRLASCDSIVRFVISQWEEGRFRTWEEAMTACVCCLAEDRQRLLTEAVKAAMNQQPSIKD